MLWRAPVGWPRRRGRINFWWIEIRAETYQSIGMLHELCVDLAVRRYFYPWAIEVPIDRTWGFHLQRQEFGIEHVQSNAEHRRSVLVVRRVEHHRWLNQRPQRFYCHDLENRDERDRISSRIGSMDLPFFFMCRTRRDNDRGGRLVFDMNKRFRMILLNLVPVRRARKTIEFNKQEKI